LLLILLLLLLLAPAKEGGNLKVFGFERRALKPLLPVMGGKPRGPAKAGPVVVCEEEEERNGG
jgi:hypothetical protein